MWGCEPAGQDCSWHGRGFLLLLTDGRSCLAGLRLQHLSLWCLSTELSLAASKNTGQCLRKRVCARLMLLSALLLPSDGYICLLTCMSQSGSSVPIQNTLPAECFSRPSACWNRGEHAEKPLCLPAHMLSSPMSSDKLIFYTEKCIHKIMK